MYKKALFFFQTRRKNMGQETCDCSIGGGTKRTSKCTHTYTCYRLYARVDYGDGVRAQDVILYDVEDNLKGKVG